MFGLPISITLPVIRHNTNSVDNLWITVLWITCEKPVNNFLVKHRQPVRRGHTEKQQQGATVADSTM